MHMIQQATDDILDIISDVLHNYRDDVAGTNKLEENKIIENTLCGVEDDIYNIINMLCYTHYYMGECNYD